MSWMQTRTISARTHGRYFVDIPGNSRGTLVGFHGYKENAGLVMTVLGQLAADRPVGLVSIQGLHRFYGRDGDVIASWMTKEDRELAIADNVAYVARVLDDVSADPGLTRPLVYVGFSQGVAMAYRAAAQVQRATDGLIALAGDVPPDVVPLASTLPKTLLGRGSEDEWYNAEKCAADMQVLRAARVDVTEFVFDGGHEWTPAFFERSRRFLDELLNG
jgi:predicted esterase